MNRQGALQHYEQLVQRIREDGLFKQERVLAGAQQEYVTLADGRQVLNLCANNYLGLANHPEVIRAARASYDTWGYGLSSVRFICGTQALHHELEGALARFLGVEDAILYSSCFDANCGLFETLLTDQDAVISDQLNHASIIDGIRLCKAKRYRYANNDMNQLESCLQQADAAGARIKLIATDGVFSMDGHIANLQAVCDLADRYGALVMVDDSHAVGFMGAQGRGTHEYCEVMGRVDILTGTLGKALGGASGGYTAARQSIVSLLRQRSRPYLFSNTLAPAIAAASLAVIAMLEESTQWRDTLQRNTLYFRQGMQQLGFAIPQGEHPIVPVMLGDASLAQRMAAMMLDKGIYVVGFFYPVVPQGQARIRTQISAVHSIQSLDRAMAAFAQCKQEMGI